MEEPKFVCFWTQDSMVLMGAGACWRLEVMVIMAHSRTRTSTVPRSRYERGTEALKRDDILYKLTCYFLQLWKILLARQAPQLLRVELLLELLELLDLLDLLDRQV